MDENNPDPKGGEICKEVEKEAGAVQKELPRLDVLKKSPLLQRRGSLGATPMEGHKEWFENFLKTNKEARTKTNPTTIDLTQAWLGEKKRARQEESFIADESSTKRGKQETTKNNEMDQTIKTMCDQITRVGKMIAEAHNPKRELKETVQRLVQQTENLKKLKASVEEKEEEQTGNILEENENLKAKLEKMEQRIEELEKERYQNRPKPIELLEKYEREDYNKWKQIADKNWEAKLLANTEIKIGSPLETETSIAKVVIVEPDDLEMEKSIQYMFKSRFPDLTDLDDPVDVLEVTTCSRKKTSTQKVIKLVWNGNEEDMWDKLIALREETKNREEIATHHVKTINTGRLQKMLKAIFQDGPNVTIYTTKNRDTAEKQTKLEEKKRKELKSYAIVVSKTEGETNETITKIKKKLHGMNSNKAIKQIRTSKEGKIVISLDKDIQALNDLSVAIESTLGPGSVTKQGEKEDEEIFYIRGLDQTATIDEVMEALIDRVGPIQSTEIRLSPLRPYGRGNQTITVNISGKYLIKLMEKTEIRVGLVRCRIEKHIELDRCHRCWAFDHKAAECKGEDRRANCFRCGKTGHNAKSCTDEENCLVCMETGHSASSGKCKVYKAAINSVRRRQQNRLD